MNRLSISKRLSKKIAIVFLSFSPIIFHKAKKRNEATDSGEILKYLSISPDVYAADYKYRDKSFKCTGLNTESRH